MSALLVIYDLNKRGQNYDCITEKMETYPTRWRVQKSAWIVETDSTEDAVARELIPCLDDNDKLFVTRVAETARWVGYTDDETQWLSDVI